MPLPRSSLARRIRSWPRGLLITLAAVIVLLIAGRIALPRILKREINARLAAVPGYAGGIDHVDLSLWRGAYHLRGIAIDYATGERREPLVRARELAFSLAWSELFHGRILSNVVLDQPEVTLVKVAPDTPRRPDAYQRWREIAGDLLPIEVGAAEVRNGLIRYLDTTRAPPIELFVRRLQVIAVGLRNRAVAGEEEFPARVSLQGESLGGGKVRLEIKADPLARQPHFHASLKVDEVDLPALNDSLRAIANVDVGRGTFRMAAEMAGRDGGFQGYVKPFFEDLEFQSREDKKKGVVDRLWEHVVAGLAWLVKNKSRDQVATRIPFSGRFGDPQVGMMATIRNLFRHGFIQAFNPTVEGSVNADNVLPDGRSADGREPGGGKAESPANAAGAPTGRPSAGQRK